MRLLLLLIFLVSCSASNKSFQNSNKKVLYFLFIDDFENNKVSLYLNDNIIIRDFLIRKSDLPQLRSISDLKIELKDNIAKVYEKELKDIIKLDNMVSGGGVFVKLKVDDLNSIFTVDSNGGNYVIFSYNKGKLKYKQVKTIR